MLKPLLFILATFVLLAIVARCIKSTEIDQDLVGEWRGHGPSGTFTGIVVKADGYGDHISVIDGEVTWGPPFRWRIVTSRLEITGIDEEGNLSIGWETLHDYKLTEDKERLTIEPPLVFSPSIYRRVQVQRATD